MFSSKNKEVPLIEAKIEIKVEVIVGDKSSKKMILS